MVVSEHMQDVYIYEAGNKFFLKLENAMHHMSKSDCCTLCLNGKYNPDTNRYYVEKHNNDLKYVTISDLSEETEEVLEQKPFSEQF